MSFGTDQGCYGNYYDTTEVWKKHICSGCDEIEFCKKQSQKSDQ